MNGQHLLRMTEDPLLVRVGGEVVGGSVVGGHVVEEVLVLRSRVLRTVRGRVAQHRHEGGRLVPHLVDEVNSGVGDEVR